ncbi:zinc finger CCCH domain-containing protein 13-like [Mya arenaria]|uniref:zinc finger CCCH domain-containing protein 13-like n=1 Tax=Mya arenaria TaxID=6604 RepID=UPI0022E865B7|nr:zinc finger CCCH domain-containing protein 13-like [Mya arenaria]
MSTASAEVAGTQEEEGTVVEHGERDITPGESSDGGASGQVSESERSSEVSKTAGQEKGLGDGAADLDKDIDAMIDINVQNGQVDPDDWNIENINVDLSASSTINVLVPENASADTGIERDSGGEVGADNAAAGRDVTDAASEISVTSDATDSSLLAEAVVKKVIDSAVSLIKADQVEEDDTTDNTDGNTAINVAKVGLFQYGADSDKEESEETDDEISDVSGGENGSKDGKEKYDHSGDTAVGLFQYADMEETDRSKSPEVSELDENEDEVVDSMNDEEKANIMKLYGLEDVEEVSPASPKSASSSENGDGQSAFENKKEETVFDVQRQVYEPQARSFSVNRDPSTTDSSPRLDSQEGFGKPEGREKSEIDIELEFNEKHFGDEQEFEQSIETENAKKASMSPPLVQYESVTENGKFRIIKTAKDSAGIRVGADLLSPKVSPKTSPRDSEQSDEKNEVKLNKRSESHDTVERKKEKVAEVVEDVLGADRINVESWKVDDRGRSDSHQLETESSLDMEKIRALLAKENHLDEVGRPGISTREDGSGQRDSGKSPLSHGEHARKDRSYEKDESDRLASDSRYLEVTDSQYLQDTDRYASYDSTRDSSRFQSTYEEELLRRAYDRVPDTTGSRDITGSRDVTGSRDITGSRDTSKNSAHSRSHDSGVIPGFKTLQQQQAKWTDMFETLENDHRRDLRSQYDRHQYNIQRLQQQMEHELQKQHSAIRKKLDIHKEALAGMSPDEQLETRRYHSHEGGVPSDVRTRSPDMSRSSGEKSGRDNVTALRNSFESKSWREIYQEMRDEVDRTPSPRSARRSPDNDLESSLGRPQQSGRRSPPRGRIERSRSPSGEGSSRERSYDRETIGVSAKYFKGERERSLEPERSRERSPEGQRSRSEKSRDSVSPHVKDLLDTLNDSRSSLRGLQEGDLATERPRAGVYSSPMPLMGRMTQSVRAEPVSSSRDTTRDSTRLTRSLHEPAHIPGFSMDRAELYGGEDRRRQELNDSVRSDDSQLSYNTRINLREKHAKHLNDLRAYYEDELRELRRALSDALEGTTVSADVSVHSTAHSQLLEAENKHLTSRIHGLGEELDKLHEKLRTMEQKNAGLEKRASEYAAAYTDSKTMGIQHRAHIEELQRYCRERDELINELESRVTSAEDGAKLYKKNLEEEMELRRQDKISLQRMVNRYESLEQEFKLLQETMSATENKLYETRTDVVELNRTISKLELENKRLGRENDNLRHKVTQSLNLSTLHDSFGGPASPRDAHPARRSKSPPPTNINQSHSSKTPPEPTTDHRVPMFATSMNDWTPIIQKSKGKTPTSAVDRSRLDKSGSSSLTDLTREQRSSKSKKVEESPSLKGRQPSKSARSAREETVSSREDVSHRSQTRPKTAPEEPTRDRPRLREITPPRAMSPASQADSEVSDYSPLLKAERDLYKLRDMMRQAVAVKPSFSPPPLKLQKKFYGSERPSQKDEYTPELGVARGRKESPALSGHGKSKSSQTPSRADKPSGEKSSSRKSGSSKGEKGSEKGSKSRDRGERDRKRDDERKRDYEKNRDSEEGKVKARERQKDEDSRERSKDGEPTKSKDRDRRRDRGDSPVRNGDINSSTRFNIDFNEDMKTVTVTPRKRDSQSNKQKNLSEAGVQTRDGEPGRTNGERQANDGDSQVANTLDLMRNGQLTTRPGWENVYTSMAIPAPSQQPTAKTMEQRVTERLRSIAEMETRYDGLQVEKVQLESSINKIPMHGRVDRQNRKHKEELEERLDDVVKELGSLRMSLKRYNVLKTAG